MTMLGLPERIAAKIDASGDCWVWQGCLSGGGYGYVRWQGPSRPAHRVVWSLLVGAIPEGLVIDHLCRVRRCVNPDHLRVVTNRENVLAPSAAGAAKLAASRTHCAEGHGLLLVRPCRLCRLASSERRRAVVAAGAVSRRSARGQLSAAEGKALMLPERLRSKVGLSASGCWVWTAAANDGGYGYVSWQGKPRLAHRVVWSVLVAPIDASVHLLHACGEPLCVNPEHLRALP